MIVFFKITRAIIILSFLIGFVSCKKNGEGVNDNTTLIQCINCSDKLTFSEDKKHLFERVEFIQLETTNRCLIKKIDHIQIVDTCVFIVDANQIYKFSRTNGKFLSEIGRRGQGPDEYISVKSLFVDPVEQTIVALDLSQSKMIKYDFWGNYISSYRIAVNNNITNTALYMKNGNVVFHNELSPYSKSAYSISKTNEDLIEDLLSYGIFKLEKYSLAFSPHPMTYSSDGINCIMPYNNIVYCIKDEDSSLEAKYLVEYSGKPTNIKMAIKENPSMFETRQMMAKDNYFPGFTAIFETSGKLLLNTFDNEAQPAFFYADTDSLVGKYYSYSITPEESQPIFEISNVSENMFIAKLDAFRLYQWKEYYNDLEKIANPELRIIIENSNDENNPCFAVYHIH